MAFTLELIAFALLAIAFIVCYINPVGLFKEFFVLLGCATVAFLIGNHLDHTSKDKSSDKEINDIQREVRYKKTDSGFIAVDTTHYRKINE